MSLKDYQAKRNFDKTSEPAGKVAPDQGGRSFVIHKHDASQLHYDLRLELDGVLKSWAVPKGPSLDPGEKRLAVQVEDHPLSYADFEDVIPKGEYGAGEVIVWDRGVWRGSDTPEKDLRSGKLKFELDGEKLHGGWTLVRMHGEAGEGGKNWLLIKENDPYAQKEANYDVTDARPESVKSGRTLADLRAGKPAASQKAKSQESEDNWEVQARQVAGAQASAFPGFFTPQLATLTDEAPAGKAWLHEVKFDGYRLLALLQEGVVRLYTRNENDWTEKFPGVCQAVEALPVENAILDGEVVALRPDGISEFQALQNPKKDAENIFYYVFDLPYLAGVDLRKAPLAARKALLERLITSGKQRVLRYSQHTEGKGGAVVENACGLGLEGIISKQKDSSYVSTRTNTWRKVKCYRRQELVVGGYTDPEGGRVGFGALVLGYYDDSGQLIYAGRVGTGFNDQELKRLAKRLSALEVTQSPFDQPPTGKQLDKVHWVAPDLVVEVRFISWTDDRLVRQASFMGLREDKNPRQVRREFADHAVIAAKKLEGIREKMKSEQKKPREAEGDAVFAGIRLSNPDRVLWAEQGVTKRDLASYYVRVADLILPYIADRPLSLLRCPRGQESQCFFQKNYTDSIEPPIDRVHLQEESGERATYMSVDDTAGLVELAQLGALELHPWAARADRLDRPDLLIFDLDPDSAVAWARVVEAALRIRELLTEHGLVSFVKTSGGKGLHVIAPLERRADWARVKAFSRGIAQQMAADAPDRYVATVTKSKRKGRIFIDYLRNSRGATNVAAYSTRARAGAPISTPVRWDELDGLASAQTYHLGNIRARLDSLTDDPWDGFYTKRQSITKKMLEAVTN